ncbi:MAG: glutamate--tRNA ligase [Deltaproteobacteria bacterium]|nr:glutamate--tRNA ligase [Deltaproteobacteria bacterium]
MSTVRVRFAPSPTGQLHVGGLRTALFNYLFARKLGGKFILRIEDTDQERYVESAEAGIVQMLGWAGISPDEGPHVGGPCDPYRQSERLPLYRKVAETLIAQGNAYKCYVSGDELEDMRAQQVARGIPPKYDGRHRHLGAAEQARFEAEGRKPVVRMRIPDRDERIVVDDLVRGKVAFNSSQLDDQVLLKSDGFPTYHLAVVVDDNAMGITHVLRAEEWLPSTPKHLLLYKWLGYPLPQFAHLPLLLNPDRTKMSKRMGDTAAEDYRDKGYLPEALVNFLALLGWNPGDDRELFTLEELVPVFDLERVVKAGAVFDRQKLDWMNQHYLGRLDEAALWTALKPYVDQTPYAGADPALLRRVCRTVQPSLVVLSDIGKHLALFFRADSDPVAAEVGAALAEASSKTVFNALRARLKSADRVDALSFKEMMKAVQKETGIKGKALYGPVRMAITREAEGPDLAEVVDIFGRDKVLRRIELALN